MALQLNYTLDDDTFRHYLNGHCVVMHSHHYLALITKLVEDLGEIGGTQILVEVVEESMREILDDYIRKHGPLSPQQRVAMGSEYYSVFGLGKLHFSGDESGGEVRIVSSHLDEGWVRKWGERETPVNYFTCGYLAAVFGAAFDKPTGSYRVREEASIVSGAAAGKFAVVLNPSPEGGAR